MHRRAKADALHDAAHAQPTARGRRSGSELAARSCTSLRLGRSAAGVSIERPLTAPLDAPEIARVHELALTESILRRDRRAARRCARRARAARDRAADGGAARRAALRLRGVHAGTRRSTARGSRSTRSPRADSCRACAREAGARRRAWRCARAAAPIVELAGGTRAANQGSGGGLNVRDLRLRRRPSSSRGARARRTRIRTTTRIRMTTRTRTIARAPSPSSRRCWRAISTSPSTIATWLRRAASPPQPHELARRRQDDAARAHAAPARRASCRSPSSRAIRRPQADAERIRAAGGRAVQINTGTGCHLDAAMVARALDELSTRTAASCSSRTSATSSARRCSISARARASSSRR